MDWEMGFMALDGVTGANNKQDQIVDFWDQIGK